MRKSDFLDIVKEQIKNIPPKEIKGRFLEFADYISHDEYTKVLALLAELNNQPINIPVDLLAAVRDICASVKNGEFGFSWDYEDYYDGFWDHDYVLIDENGLGGKLTDLLELTTHFVAGKRYEEAFQAFEGLFSIEIFCEDYDEIITISTLFNNNMIKINESDILRYYAYAAIMALRGGKRVQKLFEIIHPSLEISIQDVANVGSDEIPERDVFARQWVNLLMKQKPFYYAAMLIDAVKFSGGVKALRDFVDKHGVTYQIAYVELIKDHMDEKQYNLAIDVAVDGLSKLEHINKNRTEISDLLLEIGTIVSDSDLIKKAKWEGFCSAADLKHFMSLYDLNDADLTARSIEFLDNNRQKESLDYHYIHFLGGDYGLLYDACKKDKKSLGWSMSIKGRILPLFIALLADGQFIMPCTYQMIKNSFFNDSLYDKFIEIFLANRKSLSDSDYKTYYDWCIKEIKGRVEGIVKNQYRGSYFKASALIVSMAEAIRSKDNDLAATSFIMGYKEKYPKHNSFRKCLREDIKRAGFENLF